MANQYTIPTIRQIRFVIDPKTNCWNCTSHKGNKDGYPKIGFSKPYKGSPDWRLNRLMAYWFGRDIENKFICHTCDNVKCINPEHLFVGLPKENSIDMVLKGRSAKGERSANSKLTQEDVEEIRNFKGYYKEMLEKFNIVHSTYYRIRNKRNWRHV